jgi:hypothetical protein
MNQVTIRTAPQSDTELARRLVRVRLPAWLAGGDPLDFGRMCRWRMEVADPVAGEWDVRLDERVRRRPARLLQVNRLADSRNADAAGAYSRLRRLPASENLYGLVPRERVQAELDRVGSQRPGDLAALMYQVMLATLSSAPAQLPDIVRQALRDHLLPVLPDAAVYLVEVDEALGKRYGATRLLRQVEDDSAMSLRPPALRADKPVFNAARGLSSDTSLGLDAYLSPLFLALSPWVWAVPAKRIGGVVVYSFGCPVVGRRGEAAELLQLFFPDGRSESGPRPEACAADVNAALTWWTGALDRLFTEVTDPAEYAAEDGTYRARENFEALLSIQQAFRNVQSLSANARDNHVRRVLLFDTLDTLEGLRSPDFQRMCELSYAQRVLDEVTGLVGVSAGRVLLPRARQAVSALRRLQDGFFAPSRLQDGGLLVPRRDGTESAMSLEKAASAYLRVLRNGGHAFGGRSQPADGVLLTAHDGDVPVDLPDLAYLYLLHLLARPHDLRRRRAPRQIAGGAPDSNAVRLPLPG